MNSHEVFIHIHQGCFAGTGAIVRLPQCQWSKPDGYGKISQCITTTKHSKAKTVCIFLGTYCTLSGTNSSVTWIEMKHFVQENIFENAVFKIAAILFRPQYVQYKAITCYACIGRRTLQHIIWYTHVFITNWYPKDFLSEISSPCDRKFANKSPAIITDMLAKPWHQPPGSK